MLEELKGPRPEIAGERCIKRLKSLLLYYFFINVDGLRNSESLTFPLPRAKTIPKVWSYSPAPQTLGCKESVSAVKFNTVLGLFTMF